MDNKKTSEAKLQVTTELVLATMVEKICHSQLREFISAPMKFLKNNLQVEIPRTTRIRFSYNSDKSVALVLPYYNVSPSSQLLASQLMTVTQGAWGVISVVAIGAAIGASVGGGGDESLPSTNHMQKGAAEIAPHMTDIAYIVA